jgi:uncharacterized membrane protein
MFQIIGGDGKEYGPASPEQIAKWIADGRANRDTLARPVGTEEWKPLGELAEFAAVFAPPLLRMEGPPESVVAPGAAAGEAFVAAAFDPLSAYARSWAVLTANFWPVIGVTLLLGALYFGMLVVVVGVMSAFGLQPARFDLQSDSPAAAYFRSPSAWVGLVPGILFVQPLVTGYFYYLLRLARGEPASLADLFGGFTRAYATIVAATVTVDLLVGATLALSLLAINVLGGVISVGLIVLAIYLLVCFSLTMIVIVDRQVGVGTAMMISFHAVRRRWWSVFLIGLIALLITLLGALAFLVGLLAAIPLISGAFVQAYLALVPPRR